MKERVVLVCGSRDWSDGRAIYAVLSSLGPARVIQGGARGADTLAKHKALAMGCVVDTYAADWKRQGKAAGVLRNQRMLEEGKPDLVVAFPLGESRGTWDMVRRALKAGVRTWVWNVDRIEDLRWVA